MWALRGPDYFSAGPTLFPTWPIWRPERARALLGIVLVVLFLPKLLAVVLALRRRESADYGGAAALLRSVLLESLSSALFAPIHMAFYCRFVLLNLLGRAVGWSGGDDDVQETTWREAWRRHGPDTGVACAWADGRLLAAPDGVLVARAGRGRAGVLGAAVGAGEPAMAWRSRPSGRPLRHAGGERPAARDPGSRSRAGARCAAGRALLERLPGRRRRPLAERRASLASARTAAPRPQDSRGAAPAAGPGPGRRPRGAERSGEAGGALGRFRAGRAPRPCVEPRAAAKRPRAGGSPAGS